MAAWNDGEKKMDEELSKNEDKDELKLVLTSVGRMTVEEARKWLFNLVKNWIMDEEGVAFHRHLLSKMIRESPYFNEYQMADKAISDYSKKNRDKLDSIKEHERKEKNASTQIEKTERKPCTAGFNESRKSAAINKLKKNLLDLEKERPYRDVYNKWERLKNVLEEVKQRIPGVIELEEKIPKMNSKKGREGSKQGDFFEKGPAGTYVQSVFAKHRGTKLYQNVAFHFKSAKGKETVNCEFDYIIVGENGKVIYVFEAKCNVLDCPTAKLRMKEKTLPRIREDCDGSTKMTGTLYPDIAMDMQVHDWRNAFSEFTMDQFVFVTQHLKEEYKIPVSASRMAQFHFFTNVNHDPSDLNSMTEEGLRKLMGKITPENAFDFLEWEKENSKVIVYIKDDGSLDK